MENKKNTLLYIGIAAIVVVLVAYLLFKTSIGTSPLYNTTVSSSELASLSAIANNQTLAGQVGIGAYAGLSQSYAKQINETPLSHAGKPELLYVGAEFCPYCAATRWPLIIALMRFGTFSNIIYSYSSSTDVFPDTPTFTFINSSYSSSYLSFVSYETETRTGTPLQQMDNISEAQYSKYGDAIPFLDFGNMYVESGAVLSPGIYKGLSWAAITSQLSQNSTTVSQETIGAANIYTAEICKMINNNAPVCSQGYVKAAESRFFA